MSDDTTTATPEVTTKVDESLPSDWVSGLPEVLRDAPGLRPLKDGTIRSPEEARAALDNFAQLQGNMSETHIKIPSPDSSDESKQQTRERILSLWDDLRVVTEDEDTLPPEDASGYKIPEGLDPAAVADITQFALEHKWGQKQFEDYANKALATQIASGEKATAWEKEQSDKLDSIMGAAKAEKLGRIASALEQSGAATEYVDAITAGKIDADLVIVYDSLVSKMMEMGDEGSQFVQQVKTDARALTPSEHRDRAIELFNTLQEMNSMDPRYDEINRKRMEHIGLSREH